MVMEGRAHQSYLDDSQNAQELGFLDALASPEPTQDGQSVGNSF